MNNTILRNFIYRLELFFSRINHDLIKKFKVMDKYEKIIAIGTLGLFVLVLFTPLMSVSSNESIEQGSQYIFFLTNVSSWKSFLLIEGSVLLSLLWLFHNKLKIYIVENLGFQGNNYLFLCFLFTITLTSFVSIGDIVNIFTVHTTVLTLTPLYYISLIVLILLLSFCFYLSMYKSKRHFKGHVVGYHEKKENIENDSDGSLFDTHHQH